MGGSDGGDGREGSDVCLLVPQEWREQRSVGVGPELDEPA